MVFNEPIVADPTFKGFASSAIATSFLYDSCFGSSIIKLAVADKVFCVGPYVLSGGELPVMTVVDSVVRLIPGALGNPESLAEESFSTDIEREYPQYTRPAEYNGWKVPEVLLSGDHKKINEWRKGK